MSLFRLSINSITKINNKSKKKKDTLFNEVYPFKHTDGIIG